MSTERTDNALYLTTVVSPCVNISLAAQGRHGFIRLLKYVYFKNDKHIQLSLHASDGDAFTLPLPVPLGDRGPLQGHAQVSGRPQGAWECLCVRRHSC